MRVFAVVVLTLAVLETLNPARAQSEPIVLRAPAVRMTTAVSGGVETRAVTVALSEIRIRDGSIAGVGEPSSAAADYDLGPGITLLPGAIDTHNHFAWHFDPDGKLHDASPAEESVATEALYALENAYRTLTGGVTTVQSVGSAIDLDVRRALARGVLPGPRVLTSLQPLTERTGSPAEIREAVRQRAAAGADVIKLFASASIRVGGTPTMSQAQLDAACAEARSLGLRTVVHAHGPESVRRTVAAGCTTVEHGALLDAATLRLLAERGVYYDPHIGLIFRNYFANRDRYIGVGGYNEEGFRQMEAAVPKALATFKQALATPGLEVVFGTDAVAGAHGRELEELIYRVEEGGQAPADAIWSATRLAAESIGLQEEIGRLETGFAADIIGVEGNPLADITALRRVAFVMRGGVVVKAPPVPR